jgi:uncharacterized protein YjbI with pentapeptide repeats
VTARSDRTARNRRAGVAEPAEPDLPADLTAASPAAAELSDGAVHAGLAVADLDLSGQAAAGAEIEACRYRAVNLGQVRLSRTTIRDAEFDRCDLANLRGRDCSMHRVVIRSSRMTGFSWISGVMRDVAFLGCRIDLGYFSNTKFGAVVFSRCRLEQANFQDADLSGVRFEDCDLSGAQFSGATMAGTRLSGCELTAISGVTSLRGAIIARADAIALTGTFAEALGITIDAE